MYGISPGNTHAPIDQKLRICRKGYPYTYAVSRPIASAHVVANTDDCYDQLKKLDMLLKVCVNILF